VHIVEIDAFAAIEDAETVVLGDFDPGGLMNPDVVKGFALDIESWGFDNSARICLIGFHRSFNHAQQLLG
jgi:hypothetical protein